MSDVIDRPPLHLVRPSSPPRGGRPNRKAIVAGVAALAVLVGLLGWLLPGGSGPHRTVASGPPKTAHTGAGIPHVRAASTACHLPAGSQVVPMTTPAGVRWSLFDGVALPYSVSYGPEFVHGAIARCYAHSPTGAVFAATQIATRELVSADWRQVVAEQVVPGPGRTAYSRLRAQVNDTSEAPGYFCQVAAFSVLRYTPAAASTEMVSRCGGNLEALTIGVAWSGTDWRLVLLPNGSQAPSGTTIDNLTGFVPWGGV